MASFFSRLFGGKTDKAAGGGPGERGDPVTYNDVVIRAAPMRRDGQWLLAGVIIKSSGDENLERTFIRADTFASKEEAETAAIRKAKQIVDERGKSLFADGAEAGNV